MKRYRNDGEWHKLFAEQKRCGQSVKQFCLAKGIHSNVFYRKKKWLEKAGGLVRLPGAITDRASIEITGGGLTVGVRGGFTEGELVRILKCVKEALDA